jgi:hypothetical protein
MAKKPVVAKKPATKKPVAKKTVAKKKTVGGQAEYPETQAEYDSWISSNAGYEKRRLEYVAPYAFSLAPFD